MTSMMEAKESVAHFKGTFVSLFLSTSICLSLDQFSWFTLEWKCSSVSASTSIASVNQSVVENGT